MPGEVLFRIVGVRVSMDLGATPGLGGCHQAVLSVFSKATGGGPSCTTRR
jgi:hypothetical protein